MEIKYRSRISYTLNPFTYCRLLNDRIRSASLTRSYGIGNDYKYYEKPKCVQENIVEYEIVKKPCHRPILAIRKWKYWVYKPSYIYNSKRKCCECIDGFSPNYFLPKSIEVINGLYVFEKVVSIIKTKYI